MNADFAVEVVKALISHSLQIAVPILLTAMSLGLGVGMFQAVTSIHEQTLTFVPKVLGIAAVIFVTLPWALRVIMQFTTIMIQKMPEMAR